MIPRHEFICWTVILNRLSTKDRQIKCNPLLASQCFFCDLPESKDHLFYECSSTSRVWTGVISRTSKNGLIPTKWRLLVEWAIHDPIRKTNVNIHAKLALQACIYTIWTESNSRNYNHSNRTVEEAIQLIIQDMRYRVYGRSNDREREPCLAILRRFFRVSVFCKILQIY